MSNKLFIDNAKVMAKGQVTIPKDIREVLGINSGDHISFIVEGNTVRIVNSAVYAMQIFQQEMRGEAKRAGLNSEKDVMNLMKKIRSKGGKE
jgi:antitoxin PrlF